MFLQKTVVCATMTQTEYQTVDAEITAETTAQRTREAVIRVRNDLSNGPRRAQGNGIPEYSATRGHASVAGDMQVSRKGHRLQVCEIKVAPRIKYSSLAIIRHGRFFVAFHSQNIGGKDYDVQRREF